MKIVKIHAEKLAFAGTRWPVRVTVSGFGILRVGRAWRVVLRAHSEVFLVDVDSLAPGARDGARCTLEVRAGSQSISVPVSVLHHVPVGPPSPRVTQRALRVRAGVMRKAAFALPRRLQLVVAESAFARLRPRVAAPPMSSSTLPSDSAGLPKPSASEMP